MGEYLGFVDLDGAAGLRKGRGVDSSLGVEGGDGREERGLLFFSFANVGLGRLPGPAAAFLGPMAGSATVVARLIWPRASRGVALAAALTPLASSTCAAATASPRGAALLLAGARAAPASVLSLALLRPLLMGEEQFARGGV